MYGSSRVCAVGLPVWLPIAALGLSAQLPASAQTQLPPLIVESASRAVRPPPPAAPERRADVPSATSSQTTTPGVAEPGGSASGNAESDGDSATTSPAPGTLLVNQGTAATVVTGQQLRDQQIRTPVEALRGLPGVAVGRTGGFGGFTQVRIRGAEGNQTLVLVDGAEINNPADGEFDFSNLVGSEEIERIEVLRGPQSGLYGSGAIGGVVNIVTKSGKGPLSLTTRAEAGSFGTREAAAALSGGNDHAWGLLGFQQRRTDGFNIARFGAERDGSQTSSSIIKGGFRPLENLTIEALLRHTGKRGQRDEENFFVPGVLIEQIDARSRFSSNLWVGALEAKLSLLGGAWVQSFRSERRSITNDDLSVNPAFAPFEGFERYRSNGELWRYTSTFRLDRPGVPQVRHYLTGLAETRHEGFIQHTYDGIDHERRLNSFAGELKGEYWNSLFLTGSIRRDDSDVFGDFTTWRTSASLKVPGTPVRLHASAGTGVKFPTLFEQFGRVPFFFSPNPNLRPETAMGWDAGAELTLLGGRIVLDATWFETDLKDKIRGANGGTTVVNLPGTSTREGLELSGRLMPMAGLSIGASYTWLEAREPTGLVEVRRPRSSGRADVTYGFDRHRAKIGFAVLYNGSLIDEALRAADPFVFPLTPERVVLKDYWILSAMASYKLTPTLEIYGRAENLLDQRYQEVYGFETPGLAVYGGVRVTLQDTSTASPAAR